MRHHDGRQAYATIHRCLTKTCSDGRGQRVNHAMDSAVQSVAALATPKGHRHQVRHDIEGLRALAVLSVLIDHAFPNVLPGGFAGVDIFFVISGYLIGRHLLQDIQAGRLSILGSTQSGRAAYFRRSHWCCFALGELGGCVFRLPNFRRWGSRSWPQYSSRTTSCFGRKAGTSTRRPSKSPCCTCGRWVLKSSSICSSQSCSG